MQPGRRSDSVGQQRVALTAATMETAVGRRLHRITVKPFDHAAFEGARLGRCSLEAAIELHNARSLVKESYPVLARPIVNMPEQCDDLSLMPRKRLDHSSRRRKCRAQ